MKITITELKQLEEAPNSEAWDKVVDKIRGRRNGQYPPDWAAKVLFGGLKPKVDIGIKILGEKSDD